MRVVQPGGILIASRGARGKIRSEGIAPTDDWDRRVISRFFAEAGDPPWPPGLDGIAELDEHLRERCAAIYELPGLLSEGSSSVNEQLANMEAGYWAACWSIDEPTRNRAAARTRKWAQDELGDLDKPRPTIEGSVWHVYRLGEKG